MGIFSIPPHTYYRERDWVDEGGQEGGLFLPLKSLRLSASLNAFLSHFPCICPSYHSFIHSFINNQFNNPFIIHPSMLCLISAADCLSSSLLILCLFYSRRFFSPTQTWPSASQPLGSFPMAADKHSYISSSSVSPDAWRGQNNFSKFDIISC